MEIVHHTMTDQVMAELLRRYGAFVRYDPRLQRYLDAMPQAIKQMEQSLQGGYQTLHPLFTRMLPLVALGDNTPQLQKFAPPALDGWSASRRELTSMLCGYFGADVLRPHETTNKVNRYMEGLAESFSDHVRAFMCLDGLTFYEHPFVTGKGNKDVWPVVLSIDTAQLQPLMERYGIKSEDQFFRGLGINMKEAPYMGSRDEYNRCVKRIIITDPQAVAHIKTLKVNVEPSSQMYQISHDMREKRRQARTATVEAGHDNILAFEGKFAKDVLARRARRAARREGEDEPVR